MIPREKNTSCPSVKQIRNWIWKHSTIVVLNFSTVWIFSLIASLFIYYIEEKKFLWIDCLFMAITGSATNGLSTLVLGEMKTGSVVIILLLSLFFGPIFTIFPLCFRIKRLNEILRSFKEGRGKLIFVDSDEPLFDGKRKNVNITSKILSLIRKERLALAVIIVVVPLYIFLTHSFTFAVLNIYYASLNNNPFIGENTTAAAFTIIEIITGFAGNGLTPLSSSLILYNRDAMNIFFVLFICLAGNVGFPVLIHFFIYTVSKIVFVKGKLKDSLSYIIKHPRICYSNIFPSKQEKWLGIVVILYTSFESITILALNWNNNDVWIGDMSPGLKILNSIFQAVSSRAAGFNSINIAPLHPASILVVFIMMYVAIIPVKSAILASEEKSHPLITENEEELEPKITIDDPEHETWQHTIWNEIKGTLSKSHLTIALLSFWIILMIEGERMVNDPNSSIWILLFECCSAYGTVGLSYGHPTVSTAYSTVLKPESKFLICLIMSLGKIRGLPNVKDRAIILGTIDVFTTEYINRKMMKGKINNINLRYSLEEKRTKPRKSKDSLGRSSKKINDDEYRLSIVEDDGERQREKKNILSESLSQKSSDTTQSMTRSNKYETSSENGESQ